jgi:hypothetical protein
VLANVRKKKPPEWILTIISHFAGNLRAALLRLFQKQHMPPRGCTQGMSVVIRVTAPTYLIRRHVVPFLASHLAGFAADANRWVSEKTNRHFVLHVSVPPLVRTMNTFADHINGFSRVGRAQE